MQSSKADWVGRCFLKSWDNCALSFLLRRFWIRDPLGTCDVYFSETCPFLGSAWRLRLAARPSRVLPPGTRPLAGLGQGQAGPGTEGRSRGGGGGVQLGTRKPRPRRALPAAARGGKTDRLRSAFVPQRTGGASRERSPNWPRKPTCPLCLWSGER